jgi:hypothetical protein
MTDRAARIAAAAPVIAYLEADPDFYQCLAVLARLTAPGHSITIQGRDAIEAEALADRKRMVTDFFRACFYDPCPQCLVPVVTFMDSRSIDWPSLRLHECGEDLPMPSQRVQNAVPRSPQAQPERRARTL